MALHTPSLSRDVVETSNREYDVREAIAAMIFGGVFERYPQKSQQTLGVSRTSNNLEKKWTFDLFIKRATSGRHVFEANIDLFALILQVHGAKPLDDLV